VTAKTNYSACTLNSAQANKNVKYFPQSLSRRFIKIYAYPVPRLCCSSFKIIIRDFFANKTDRGMKLGADFAYCVAFSGCGDNLLHQPECKSSQREKKNQIKCDVLHLSGTKRTTSAKYKNKNTPSHAFCVSIIRLFVLAKGAFIFLYMLAFCLKQKQRAINSVSFLAFYLFNNFTTICTIRGQFGFNFLQNDIILNPRRG